MLPPLPQRLLILVALLLGGGFLWWAGRDAMVVGQGAQLLSPGGVMLLLLALPAAGLGLIVSATGHPATGLFVLGVCLLIPAAVGGPIDAELYRLQSVSRFGVMLAEAALWLALLVGYAALLKASRGKLRNVLPGSLLRAMLAEGAGGQSDAEHDEPDPWGFSPVPLLTSLGIAVIVGGVLGVVMLQSSRTGQVFAGLILAFAAAGALARSVAPRMSVVGVIASPLVVAGIGYAWVLVRFRDNEALLKAWFTGELWGLATARPIDFASAGVTGCVIGIGIARGIARARLAHLEAAPGPA
ncbi:MAG: hypothetical protein ACOC3G_00865 [Phycisphaeraceae bacterium]